MKVPKCFVEMHRNLFVNFEILIFRGERTNVYFLKLQYPEPLSKGVLKWTVFSDAKSSKTYLVTLAN